MLAAVAVCTAGTRAHGATAPTLERAGGATWFRGSRELIFIGARTASPASHGLYAIDVRSLRVRMILRLPDVGGVSSSPDNRQLAIQRLDGLWLLNSDGSNLHRLLRNGLNPAWSPGGHWIAFDDGRDVEAVAPDGRRRALVASPLRQRRDDYHVFAMPSWSRDGQRLAFCIVPAPDTVEAAELGIVSRFGGRIRRYHVGFPNFPDWSPDGRRLAFAQLDAQGTATIAVLEPATGRVRRLHPGSDPRWSPDGRWIAFTEGGQLFLTDLSGARVVELTKKP